MRRVQPGFTDAASLQTLRIAIPNAAAADDARLLAMQQELAGRLAALPGATALPALLAPAPFFMNSKSDFCSLIESPTRARSGTPLSENRSRSTFMLSTRPVRMKRPHSKRTEACDCWCAGFTPLPSHMPRIQCSRPR